MIIFYKLIPHFLVYFNSIFELGTYGLELDNNMLYFLCSGFKFINKSVKKIDSLLISRWYILFVHKH
jgi:hypothetical protein